MNLILSHNVKSELKMGKGWLNQKQQISAPRFNAYSMSIFAKKVERGSDVTLPRPVPTPVYYIRKWLLLVSLLPSFRQFSLFYFFMYKSWDNLFFHYFILKIKNEKLWFFFLSFYTSFDNYWNRIWSLLTYAGMWKPRSVISLSKLRAVPTGTGNTNLS